MHEALEEALTLNVHDPPLFKETATLPVDVTGLLKLKAKSMSVPALYAPSGLLVVTLEIIGAAVFHGGILIPELYVAKTLPRLSETVPFPLAEYDTVMPDPPADDRSETVSTTFVLSDPGDIEATANVVPDDPVFATEKPPSLDFVIVAGLADLLKVTVI